MVPPQKPGKNRYPLPLIFISTPTARKHGGHTKKKIMSCPRPEHTDSRNNSEDSDDVAPGTPPAKALSIRQKFAMGMRILHFHPF